MRFFYFYFLVLWVKFGNVILATTVCSGLGDQTKHLSFWNIVIDSSKDFSKSDQYFYTGLKVLVAFIIPIAVLFFNLILLILPLK